MFQVAQNVPAQNSYKNESKSAEYDIVILINGIPLVLIELKKRSLDKGLDKVNCSIFLDTFLFKNYSLRLKIK
ncbi:type I restriction endonuclease ['Santalum album' aster yellows phytoplasma]|uniref:Restriction endonuclease type I HsdR N-terminal domain-containing protein n=1 Tax='Santalum album' aster yellows phytoplasma TaxID=2831467 RepID=A0ABS5LLF3_9MOLU|nr:hypothetical protein ['Santalum album' aster yellows phytoplasma]